MRISISNIAWDVAEDEKVASLLQRYSVNAIDVAPGKYFPDPARATAGEVEVVRKQWANRGVDIIGMQALLFGTAGLNMFADESVQQAMLKHLEGVCRIGAGLGATRLVFGSPKNRDRTGLTDDAALDVAAKFFTRLGDIAQSNGVSICLEPNPPCYGANFMTTSAETASVVKLVGHEAIKMQLDTGAVTINSEHIEPILQQYGLYIGHVHASEPDLLPLGDGACNHQAMAAGIRHYLPAHTVTIEMVATKSEPHMISIERALQTAIAHYRVDAGVTA